MLAGNLLRRMKALPAWNNLISHYSGSVRCKDSMLRMTIALSRSFLVLRGGNKDQLYKELYVIYIYRSKGNYY